MATNSTRRPLVTRLKDKERDVLYESYLDQHPEPYPTNPFRSLRSQFDITIQGLADTLGVTKQYLIRVEQGTIAKAPEVLINYWVGEGYSERYLVDAYEDFQLSVRSRHHRLFGDLTEGIFWKPDSNHEFSGKVKFHPLLLLALCWVGSPDGANLTQVAKMLCVSQSLLSNWVKSPKQAKIPSPLWDALIQAGYSKSELILFHDAYIAYRKEQGYE